MSKIDVVFIHANAAKKVYQSLSNEHSAIEPPIWAGMLANSCLKSGFSAEVIDCEAESIGPDKCAERVEYLAPRLAVFAVYGQQPSASSQNMEGAVDYATELKRLCPTVPIMFVGGHVAALPREVLGHDCVDLVCQNEGVYTILDALTVPDMADQSVLREIRGLGWKSGGQCILNKPSDIVTQGRLQHDLPGVAWRLLPSLDRYRTAGWHAWANGSVKSPFVSLYTSLGCPWRCDFCMINIINRTDNSDHVTAADSNVFRYWEPEFIIEQFDYFAKMGVKNIKIADELFMYNVKHFKRLCELLAERDYGFSIWAYARVDTCKPQHLEIMKKAGINYIALGVESPDQVVRGDVVKGGYAEVKIQEVFKQVHNAGIFVGANYILGLPKDTAASMKYTVDFARSHLTENFNIYCAMAYPGSPLYLDAKRRGVTLPDRYAGWSQHSYWTQNLPTETLSAAEVLAARDAAWESYFLDPAYHDFLRSRFGQAAVDNVKSTLGIKLRRRLLGD